MRIAIIAASNRIGRTTRGGGADLLRDDAPASRGTRAAIDVRFSARLGASGANQA